MLANEVFDCIQFINYGVAIPLNCGEVGLICNNGHEFCMPFPHIEMEITLKKPVYAHTSRPYIGNPALALRSLFWFR